MWNITLQDYNFRIEKSDNGTERRLIHGFATTESWDVQKEKVLTNGLDTSYFLKKGYINWDHDSTRIVGEPTMAEIRTVPNMGGLKGLYVEGEIYDNKDGDMVWEHLQTLNKSKTRKLGLSIEGIKQKVTEDGTIHKAVIRGLAITPHPVNEDATLDIMIKSLMEGVLRSEEMEKDRASILFEKFENAMSNIIDRIEKALKAGYTTDPEQMEGGETLREEGKGKKKGKKKGDCKLEKGDDDDDMEDDEDIDEEEDEENEDESDDEDDDDEDDDDEDDDDEDDDDEDDDDEDDDDEMEEEEVNRKQKRRGKISKSILSILPYEWLIELPDWKFNMYKSVPVENFEEIVNNDESLYEFILDFIPYKDYTDNKVEHIVKSIKNSFNS